MEYKEDEYLMLSGIQHYTFCRRQWALIHIEKQWEENYKTISGNIFHEKTHDKHIKEKRKDIIIMRGVSIFSREMGISGDCDVVEFHEDKDGISLHGREKTYHPIPIEYKNGKPKENNMDELQLCAQAMCLEEMFLCDILYGYLFYGETRRRTKVEFTKELRDNVILSFDEMHQLYKKGYTPKVKVTKACKSCSLANICVPKLNKNRLVSKYIDSYMSEVEG